MRRRRETCHLAWGLLVVVAIALLPAAPVGAEEPAPPATLAETAASPAVADGELFATYQIRLGDRVRSSVWGESELTADATVMPDGTVSLPLIGTVPVVGKTVPEVTGEVRQAYARYLKEPRVSLSCVPRNPPQVYFEGAVPRPGPVDYDPQLRLMDYLGLVGGPSPGADLSRVVITSGRGPDLTRTAMTVAVACQPAGQSQNPVLRPGDTVWIGKALPVGVIGAVVKPGAFEYQAGFRLSDYLSLAGGPTNRAILKRTVLKRNDGSQVCLVDLSAALRAPDSPEANPVLAPGDVVTVPEAFLAGTLEWSDVLRALAGPLIWR
jgi:polysaccharide export outer membrane protein